MVQIGTLAVSIAENVCTLLCQIPPQLNYATVDTVHVYHSIQLNTYTSPLSCVLTNIKANIQVLCLKYLTKIEKTNFEPM